MMDKRIINYGPIHPSVHGALRLLIETEGEKVLSINPDIGYMHRGIEKIVESKTYQQIIPFLDRVDYVSAACQEHTYVLACEKLANIDVPLRAQFIRVLIAELTRIGNHLIHFNMLTYDTGALSPFVWAMEVREKLMWIFESICGARMHLNYFTIGGVVSDISVEILENIKFFLANLKKTIDSIEKTITKNPIFIDRTQGVGCISKEKAIEIGATGSILRASGVEWDLRRNQPYEIYDKLDFLIPVGKNGDCYDRYLVKVYEVYESIKIIEQCLKYLPELEWHKPNFGIPKKGELYFSTEAPKGEMGIFLVSEGSNKPYRLHIRSTGFPVLMNISRFVNNLVDLPVILASLDIVLGDVDR